MANFAVVAEPSASQSTLADLSRDLLKVAERIQDELSTVSFEDITPDALIQVEEAEAAVDTLARDLSLGLGDVTQWHTALTDYEAAWFRLVASLGERRN